MTLTKIMSKNSFCPQISYYSDLIVWSESKYDIDRMNTEGSLGAGFTLPNDSLSNSLTLCIELSGERIDLFF